MPSTPMLGSEKVEEAVEILREQDVDLWITRVYSTSLLARGEPAQGSAREQRERSGGLASRRRNAPMH